MRRKNESIQAYRKRVAKRRAETKGKSVKTQLKETGSALKGLFKKKSKSKPGAKPRATTTTKAPAKPPLKAAKRNGPKVTGKDTKLGPLKGQSLLKQTVGGGKNKKLNVTKEQLKASGMSLNGYANYMKKHGKRPPRMSMLRKK
jgi:hypothetical protein